jgi:tetratricopeptide (TPR) repeat protein
MSYIKKRVPRKPGMTPQEILADQKTLFQWFEENTNLVVYTAGAAILILVIVLGYIWMKNSRTEAADSALSHAMATYQVTVKEMPDGSEEDADNLEMALEQLEVVASEYPRSHQGQTASLFKANVLFRLGKFSEAAATIEELKKKNMKLIEDVNAFYLLARCYEALEDYQKAIDSYSTAKRQAGGDMLAIIDIDLARCHELSGDVDKAAAIYSDIVSQYPETIYSTRAEKKLAILGMTDQETL